MHFLIVLNNFVHRKKISDDNLLSISSMKQEREGGWIKTLTVVHKMPRYNLLIYYKIFFFNTPCLTRRKE